MTRRKLLRVRNFERFQHYKDRNPAWIKLYCSILEDYDFQQMPDDAKFHCVGLMLLASRLDNLLPDDSAWLSSKIGAKQKINLRLLLETRFLEPVKDKKTSKNFSQSGENVVEFPEKQQRKQSINGSKPLKPQGESASAISGAQKKRASTETDKRREDKKRTHTETEGDAGDDDAAPKSENRVRVNSDKSFQKDVGSQFTLEECLRYVTICQGRGQEIRNPQALAIELHRSGKADAFILATLHPEQHEEKQIEIYGEPREFTDNDCSVCHGSKMEIVKGKGARPCPNCIDERGQRTGKQPKQEAS